MDKAPGLLGICDFFSEGTAVVNHNGVAGNPRYRLNPFHNEEAFPFQFGDSLQLDTAVRDGAGTRNQKAARA